jgi:hypothetical protein
MRLSTPALVLSWIARLAAAAILGQTLFFKFSGAAESRWIFAELGVEPWGRIASGVLELAAVLLLLVPRTAACGAALTFGLMLGAVLSHLLFLGIEVQGDGGTLFALALASLVAAVVVGWLHRSELPLVGCKLARVATRA